MSIKVIQATEVFGAPQAWYHIRTSNNFVEWKLEEHAKESQYLKESIT